MKPSSSGAQEIRLDAHIAVQQHDDVVLRGAESGVRAAAETQIPFERQQLHAREWLWRTKSALPSVEPLSTTMISFVRIAGQRGFEIEGRYCSSRSRPFQLGITTLAACARGRPDVAGALARAEQHARADPSSASATARQQQHSGESNQQRK